MPEEILIRDFSGGWCPSDDSINGRPNACLKMDNVELDQNGALTLIGGTVKLYSAYPANAHTMYSKYVAGSRRDYAALTDGSVYRNGNSIITGGDPTNAAFDTAFDFVLIASGSQLKKDLGTGTPVNLGVKPPTAAPTVQNGNSFNYAQIGVPTGIVAPHGTLTSGYTIDSFQVTFDATLNGASVQVYPTSVVDTTVLSGIAIPGGYDKSLMTDNDIISLKLVASAAIGTVDLEIDVLLVAPDAAGDIVSDFYAYVLHGFDVSTGYLTIRRGDFNRVGNNGTADWNTVYGWRISFANPSSSAIYNMQVTWGRPSPITDPVNSAYFYGGEHAQYGDYTYLQVNVNNTGSYNAMSPASPVSNIVYADGDSIIITPQNPTSIDPQINEVWIFRAGGQLGGTYYLVQKIPISSFPTGTFIDLYGDNDALTLDITLNLNLISVASIGKIYDIIGPVQGRWYYFTDKFIYPSDINDPDLVDASIAIRTSSSNNENFLWARLVAPTTVLVGTSSDVYLLTGTFSTFPDQSIDLYYQNFGIKYPPITYDATTYAGLVYYLSADGWRSVSPDSFEGNNNPLIVAPSLDLLYRGTSRYSYVTPNLKINPGSIRYPIVINKNKMWCFIQGCHRCEVYDFVRNYWRTFDYQLGDVSAACSTPDNQVLAFYSTDKFNREIGSITTKLIDGTTKQAVNILLPYKDNGTPRQRKDLYTLRMRGRTRSDNIVFTITGEQDTGIVTGPLTINTTDAVEGFLDLSQIVGSNFLPKSIQIGFSGFLSDFLLTDISLDYDLRPLPLTFLRLLPSNFGSPSKKRVRTIPYIIDTRGQNVTYTPFVDNQSYPTATFNTPTKATVLYQFVSDAYGIDYGATFYDPTGQMEFYAQESIQLQPQVVQNLPVVKRFDQLGPFDFFRFGKLIKMLVRVCPQGGTQIPYKIYFSDSAVFNGTLNVVDKVDDTYLIDFPKGTSGHILRIELGPTNFDFARYYVRCWVNVSGTERDTEIQVVEIQ